MKSAPTLFILIFLFNFFSANAYHLAGGTMNYKSVGSDSFEVTLVLYRDCNNALAAPFDDPANIGVYDTSGTLIITINAIYQYQLISDSINICPGYPFYACLEKATYIIPVFNLMYAGGIDVVYQRCCRNSVLSNVQQPANTGITCLVHIPDTSIATNNSSPVFTNEMSAVLCYGVLNEFDGSAMDIDGDSLAFSLVTPLQGADETNPFPQPPPPPPYFPVVYTVPFTSQYPINSIPPIQINENTGSILVTPSSIGVYLIGEEVREFRKGIFIGKIFRDFEWTVTENVGISEVASDQSTLQLSPNPFSDFISLTSPFQSSSILSVMNSQGQIIFTKRLQPLEKISFTKNELPSSNFIFFRLISDEGVLQSGIAMHVD